MAHPAKTDIGFQAGQVLTLRIDKEAYKALVGALGANDVDRWHTLESEDEHIRVDLAQVVYVRRETGGGKVGF